MTKPDVAVGIGVAVGGGRVSVGIAVSVGESVFVSVTGSTVEVSVGRERKMGVALSSRVGCITVGTTDGTVGGTE
jgi:hypothetical protein